MSSIANVGRRGFLAGAGAVGASAMVGCETAGPIANTQPNSVKARQLTGKIIQTVRGPVAPSALGATSMHEHVLLGDGSDDGDPLEMFDEETLKKYMAFARPEEVGPEFFPEAPDHPIKLENRHYLMHHYANSPEAFVLDEALMTGELGDFHKLGGRSILDVSITNERGDPRTIRRMSEATNVNVIMSTGINSHVLIPKKYKQMSQAQLVEFFELELNKGIRGTDILAGNIKLLAEGGNTGMKATDDEVLIRGLKAAASVSNNTQAPVTVHCYALGDEVLKALLNIATQAGMPRDRMTIAHFPTALRPMDYDTLLKHPETFRPNLDIGYWAMDRGFILSFDLFGAGDAWIDTRDGQAPNYDAYSFAAIYQYAKRGYAERIVLGTDVWTRMGTRKHGGGGISQLLNFVTPTLKKYGVSQNDIDQMMIHNPARILAYRNA